MAQGAAGGGITPILSPSPSALGHQRGEGNEPGPLAQEPGSHRLLPCAMTSPQRGGEGGDDPSGSCGLGWGPSPTSSSDPGAASPAVHFPAQRFPLRDSRKRRFLPGQDACPMAPTGVPHGPGSVKCSSRHLVCGKTSIQGDILSQGLPSSTHRKPVMFKSLE